MVAGKEGGVLEKRPGAGDLSVLVFDVLLQFGYPVHHCLFVVCNSSICDCVGSILLHTVMPDETEYFAEETHVFYTQVYNHPEGRGAGSGTYSGSKGPAICNIRVGSMRVLPIR